MANRGTRIFLPAALLGCTITLATISPTSAANVAVGLDPGGLAVAAGDGRGVFDTSGNPVDQGFLGMGTFNTTLDFTNSTGAEIENAFVLFGMSGFVNGTNVGGSNIALGTFTFATVQPVPIGDPLSSQTVHVVIGNTPTISTSTELLVIDTGQPFIVDDPVPSISYIDLYTYSGTPLHGSSEFSGGEFYFPIVDLTFAAPNSYQLAPIGVPEPSGAVLLCAASLAFLRKRRRSA